MLEIVFVLAILFFSIVLHEYAHGWMAYRLGDPTAKFAGRLTLNPLKHIDPIGTILVPVVLRLLSSPFLFGWAKPVPVNFARLRHPKRDMIWVAAAGPAANLLLAFIFSRLYHRAAPEEISYVFGYGVVINVVLIVFNLLPIPPLDGSRVVMGLLPRPLAVYYGRLERYGFLILIVLLNFGLLRFLYPLVEFLAGLLGISF